MTHSAYLPQDDTGLEHENRGRNIEPGGIRLSIGLEDRDDIVADLERGLKRA